MDSNPVKAILNNILTSHSDFDALLRMTRSSRSRSYNVIKESLRRYSDCDFTWFDFDEVCAHYNDGVEFEWQLE